MQGRLRVSGDVRDRSSGSRVTIQKVNPAAIKANRMLQGDMYALD